MNKDEWSKVKEFVKSNIGESAHANWIQPIELKEINGSVAKFKVPTRFIGTWVHRNYGDHIIQGFKNQKLRIDRLEFIASSDKTAGKKIFQRKVHSKEPTKNLKNLSLIYPVHHLMPGLLSISLWLENQMSWHMQLQKEFQMGER